MLQYVKDFRATLFFRASASC